MFQRYTEKARRVIFFAHREACNAGSPSIETEHILLGLFQEGVPLLREQFPRAEDVAHITQEIKKKWIKREKIADSVNLPLSNECKRVLAYAAEEAERLHRHIGTEHLFLGILREEKSFASQLLSSRGIPIEDARRKIAGSAPIPPMVSRVEPGGGSGVGIVHAGRWIEFQNEADETSLGDSAATTVPRIGEEIVLGEIRGRLVESAITTRLAPPRQG